MNYIKELNAFYDWLETNVLSLSGIALWHALMHINNKTAWTDEFAVAVSVLSVKTGLAARTVSTARNELVQKGRIKWRQRKGNQSAIYQIIPFHPAQLQAIDACNCADKTNITHLQAFNADSHTDNHADKCADSYADNHADNHLQAIDADNYADKTHLQAFNADNHATLSSSCFNSSCCYSSVQEIQTSLQTSGILAPSFPEIQRLEYWATEGMELDVVKFAIEKAALANKRRVDYVEGILKNWFRAGIRTKQQAEAEVERFNQEKGGGIRAPAGRFFGNTGRYSGKDNTSCLEGTDWSKEPEYL